METLLDTGKRNPIAGIVMAVMTEVDAMETERLSERILSGQDQARRNGKLIGRPKGTTKTSDELIQKYPLVAKDLRAGESIRRVAAVRQVAIGTVQRIKKAIAA